MKAHGGRQRATTFVVVWSLVAAGSVAITGPAAASLFEEPPEWAEQLAEPQEMPDPVPWEEPTSAPVPESEGIPAVEVEFPSPATWEVELGDPGEAAEPISESLEAAADVAVDELPVEVSTEGTDLSGESLELEVFDRETAESVGVSGFVFRIGEADGDARVLAEADGAEGLPAELTIDYSGFAEAYGGSYGARLQVVALPPCALQDPRPSDCHVAGQVLPVGNDLDAQRLVVEVDDLAGLSTDGVTDDPFAGGDLGLSADDVEASGLVDGQSVNPQPAAEDSASESDAVVFAVTSGVSSDVGTYGATSLSPSGSWQVGTGSGEFGWSYPIDVPEPGVGDAPTVGLSYSSGVVDGLTVATNTQASRSGLGFSDFANAFIERRYEPCHTTVGTGDLCWMSDNATISLDGLSGALYPVNEERTEWRLEDDPGWKVERLTGAAYTDIYERQLWRVTAPDGTRYWFGYGHMPGRRTNSILGVEVIADETGEPCRGPNDEVAGCLQGWRWYLDRIDDPDGNVTNLLYQKETNWYTPIDGFGNFRKQYDRGAYLKEIIYGGRGWDSGTFSARVTFGTEYRCNTLTNQCGAPTRQSTRTQYPDVPFDLLCTGSTSQECRVYSPAFFTDVRYSAVRTEVKVGPGDSWRLVAQHNLIHGFHPSQGEKKLLLRQISHAGLAFDGMLAYPAIQLDYAFLPNRADVADQGSAAAMRHFRLHRIINEFGGVTHVVYTQKAPCSSSYNASGRWDLNVRDCFPQRVRDGDVVRNGVFHKYLVGSVREVPEANQPSSEVVTSYAYEGDPAWAFDTAAFARDAPRFGWSTWLGYGEVTISNGSSRNRVRVFRGWDGDSMLVQDSSGAWIPERDLRRVNVATFDGSESFADRRALAGRVLEEQSIGTVNGVANKVVESTLYKYIDRVTVPRGDERLHDAVWVGVSSITESVATAPDVYRRQRTSTTYSDNFQPVATLEEGWLDETGDERCSLTTYADNPDKWMFAYEASNSVVAGGCDSTDRLEYSETYYDNATALGAPPTLGHPTRERALVDEATGRWVETTATFDEFGRPVSATDANGGTWSTLYEVAPGAPQTHIPVRTTETNPLDQQVVTEWHPEFGVPKHQWDPNGNVTTFHYDPLGRNNAIRLPTEQPASSGEPSWRFGYDIGNRAVRSRQLVSDVSSGSGVRWEDTWVIHDGFWRERQVQTQSPTSGKVVVAETTYDDRGFVRDETVAQALDGTPGQYIAGASAWKNRTRHIYDELGREVEEQWWRDSSVAWRTTASYAHDTVTVTSPEGRQVRERVDGMGRTVAVEERDGSRWVASTYSYDLADQLRSVTDPAGNTITYDYNLAGWLTSQQDPDRGSATYVHDDNGQVVRTVDASGDQIHTIYDDLGRPTERRAGAVDGPLLASWQYDTAPGGVGMLHRETTYTDVGTWISEVTGYDSRGRSTGASLTVPVGIPGLSGQYSITQQYDRADRPTATGYPAVGGLPAETVRTTYNGLGLATSLTGADTYVQNVTFDDRGRSVAAALGPPGGYGWMLRWWDYDADQRLGATETWTWGGEQAGYQHIGRHTLTYNRDGDITRRATLLDGLEWEEVFCFDDRNRLVAAFTVVDSASCDASQRGGGDRPYVHSYAYTDDGRLSQRAVDGTTTEYQYPDSGSSQAHAPVQVGDATYTWDAEGNLTTRTVDGGTETFSWDLQGRLTSVSGPSGDSSFVYDASGQRLLRRAGGTTTLYFADHEISANADGTVVTAVRSYSFGGELIATRTVAGVEYLVTDEGGSVEMAVPSGGTPSATRAYDPYGRARSEDGEIATDRGFLGQVEDNTTGLSYLNARYYDTDVALFVSADPIYDTSKPKTLNPYSYSANNPVAFSDPSGLSHEAKLRSQIAWLRAENQKLRAENARLRSTIKVLASRISNLQGVIEKQRRLINNLLSRNRALEAVLRDQKRIIDKLRAHGKRLMGIIKRQELRISKLQVQLAKARQVINKQGRIIARQNSIIARQTRTIAALRAQISRSNWRPAQPPPDLPAGSESTSDRTPNSAGYPNASERSWCQWPSRWRLCQQAWRNHGRHAIEVAGELYPDNDGYRNATRHCIWSGRMAVAWGEDTAWGFLNRHEHGVSRGSPDYQADMYNNQVGIGIGLGTGSYGAVDHWCTTFAAAGGLDYRGAG